MSISKFIFAAGSVAAIGAGASLAGAVKLFNSVIPRQYEVRVDLKEMADEEKWNEYKKMIHPAKEWLLEQPLEHITINAGDGIKLSGHYLACKNPGKRIVICLHGYTSNGLGNFCAMAKYYLDMDFDMLIVDLRAHGESEGNYVGFGILDRFDCMKWINYTVDRFGSDVQILLYGVSMGATTALMTLGFNDLPKEVKGAVSDCAFTSPYEVFAHILKRDYHLPPFPVMNICDSLTQKKAGYRFKDYSTVTALKSTDRPVLLIHGKNDLFVPVWMTEKNYEVCNSPVEKLLIDNAGHGASYYENKAVYEEALTAFIETYFS
ncbi:MAG: alpha/beta hydrolase [Ruminococcus sp.]